MYEKALEKMMVDMKAELARLREESMRKSALIETYKAQLAKTQPKSAGK